MRYSQKQKDEAREWLLQHLQPGMTVHTILRHVTSSGMSRSISLILAAADGPLNLDHAACKLLEGFDGKHGGCKASGCGMDMGFHLVYTLGRILWPEGFGCIGPGCHSNAHSNGDRDYSPHLHKDGGYALKQSWL